MTFSETAPGAARGAGGRCRPRRRRHLPVRRHATRRARRRSRPTPTAGPTAAELVDELAVTKFSKLPALTYQLAGRRNALRLAGAADGRAPRPPGPATCWCWWTPPPARPAGRSSRPGRSSPAWPRPSPRRPRQRVDAQHPGRHPAAHQGLPPADSEDVGGRRRPHRSRVRLRRDRPEGRARTRRWPPSPRTAAGSRSCCSSATARAPSTRSPRTTASPSAPGWTATTCLLRRAARA